MNRRSLEAGAVICSAMLLAAPMRAAEAPLTVKATTVKPTIVCIDTLAEARAHANRIQKLDVEPGRAIAYDQQPPVLYPDYTGTITLAEFMVAGNVPSLQFEAVDGQVETWARQRTDTLAGRPVSVFQKSWDASILDRAAAYARWGWDQPEMLIGKVLGAGALGSDRDILLRIGPRNIPNVPVAQPAADVQYSSHVVNIVLPGFSDQMVVQGDNASALDELPRVTRRFFDVFQDTYDAIAVVPQRSMLMDYSAVHYTIKSDVAGIGQDPIDTSATFGSGGRLHAVEIFPQFFGDNQVSTHEASHQWGSYVDWTALTGLVRAGHDPSAHDPLWVSEPSRMSAVMSGARRAVDVGGAYAVARSAAPVPFTSLQRYAMGLLPKAAVPTFALFNDQAQIPSGSTPAPGTPLTGGVRTATIDQVAGRYGERSGPVPAEWSRATIVVSRGAFISQQEMNYWTYYAQRSEDPNRSGIIDNEGFGSFDLATDNRVDFKTDIRPLSGAAISAPLDVNYPSFGTTDLRGLTLNAPLATLSTAGAPITIAGRLTIPNRADYSGIAFCLGTEDRPADDVCSTSLQAGFVRLGGDGSFSVQIVPTTPDRYKLWGLLVTPAGAAASFLQVSNFTVN